MGVSVGSCYPKARKAHVCYWCGEAINIGERYSQWTWIEDSVDRVRTHNECKDAWDSLDYWEAQEVTAGDFNRGCTCERGECRCVKKTEVSK